MDEAVAWQTRPLAATSTVVDTFEAGPWGQKYSTIVAHLRCKWEQVIPFFAFSPMVRKTIRNNRHFPGDDTTNLIDLALRQIEAKWTRPPKEWQAAKSQLAIPFGEAFTLED
jgi:putative transposase